MATVIVRQPPIRPPPTPSPLAPSLSINTVSPLIPNKHLPVCSPGPAPASRARNIVTPPASPPSKQLCIQTFSILYPPDTYPKVNDSPPVYEIDAATLAAALDHMATQPLPEPKQVFPWLHGLHAENHIQLAFFIARRKSLRRTPKCIRGITLVKCGGDLSKSRLKGAIAPDELLQPCLNRCPKFHDVDPREGFSVRNFQIQAAKMALVSDIVVYGDESSSPKDVRALAKIIAAAQRAGREKGEGGVADMPVYSTFTLSSRFTEFEENCPEHVAVNSQGQMTGSVMDFFNWERREMCTMSKASEIANNVWLGPTPDSTLCPLSEVDCGRDDFDIYIEASDLAAPPDQQALERLAEMSASAPQHLEFPSSGSIMPPTWSQTEVDSLMDTCRWLYSLANPEAESPGSSEERNADGDIEMRSLPPRHRKILIHCTDGYTESTLLALAYFMYAEGIPVHEAWLRLHCEKERNFFAYPSDVALLTSIQPRILSESPRGPSDLALNTEPAWLSRMDGSLPSRILPYMYLGNLGHANNPELLKELGIKRVLSVGEPVNWAKEVRESWGVDHLLFIDRVQDNGVDPLTEEFDRCLEFIEKGKNDGTATLVHCRVGVSRSATICIAEVMSAMDLSFPRAYCFVRARRLNVIIQPHLRFTYELLKWEELQQQKRNKPLKRELEWATIAREIALMNKPYARG